MNLFLVLIMAPLLCVTAQSWISWKDCYAYITNSERKCQAKIENEKSNCIKESKTKLIERITATVAEQNNLWLKCIAVKAGKPCSITPGCRSRNGRCYPINV